MKSGQDAAIQGIGWRRFYIFTSLTTDSPKLKSPAPYFRQDDNLQTNANNSPLIFCLPLSNSNIVTLGFAISA